MRLANRTASRLEQTTHFTGGSDSLGKYSGD